MGSRLCGIVPQQVVYSFALLVDITLVRTFSPLSRSRADVSHRGSQWSQKWCSGDYSVIGVPDLFGDPTLFSPAPLECLVSFVLLREGGGMMGQLTTICGTSFGVVTMFFHGPIFGLFNVHFNNIHSMGRNSCTTLVFLGRFGNQFVNGIFGVVTNMFSFAITGTRGFTLLSQCTFGFTISYNGYCLYNFRVFNDFRRHRLVFIYVYHFVGRGRNKGTLQGNFYLRRARFPTLNGVCKLLYHRGSVFVIQRRRGNFYQHYRGNVWSVINKKVRDLPTTCGGVHTSVLG